jgi:putative PIN family toxin of toxin-antitoxin system
MSAFANHIVLDSNVIVSAILKPNSIAANALEIAIENFDVVASRESLDELLTVLKRSKFDKYISHDDRMDDLRDYINITKKIPVVLEVVDCKDPKDNKFLALAVTANARLLVSGDKKDLISMSPFRGVKIISIREFIEFHREYL